MGNRKKSIGITTEASLRLNASAIQKCALNPKAPTRMTHIHRPKLGVPQFVNMAKNDNTNCTYVI